MEIKICQNRAEWEERQNNTSASSAPAEFLQSWKWGEFQKSVGRKVMQLIGDDWQAQGFEHQLPGLGKYLYVPRFQISDFGSQNFIEYLKDKNYIFLRLEPLAKLSSSSYLLSQVKNRQPQQTLILDLTRSEEELLRRMHAKTRYNIGLAERKGVVIKQEKNIDIFWELNKKTTERDEFKSHEKKYYEKMLELDGVYQLTAYFENKPCDSAQGKPIAASIMIIFNNTATYLHGASANEFRNVMATYLLQWEGIKLGKRLNCDYYDFWGVAPLLKTENEPWAGMTRFKVGFGGEYKEYPQACDIILKPWKYWLYRFVRKIRGLK